MIEMLVGLNVTDDISYKKYREGMTPLLESIGGGFGYDFIIKEVLKSQTEDKVNRLFTIRFPDKQVMNDFFTNPEYLEIKEKYFTNAVASTTIISSYEQ